VVRGGASSSPSGRKVSPPWDARVEVRPGTFDGVENSLRAALPDLRAAHLPAPTLEDIGDG
jgi:hypothetical protein